MHASIENLLARYRKDGRLAVFANLLFDVVLVGWIVFAGLYALEVLLPTFVTARLSLVKASVILLFLTSLLAWLGSMLGAEKDAASKTPSHPVIISTTIVALGIIALAHYRFPYWSIPILIIGYAIAIWIFAKGTDRKKH